MPAPLSQTSHILTSVNTLHTRRVFAGVLSSPADNEGVTVLYTASEPTGSGPGRRDVLWTPQNLMSQVSRDCDEKRPSVCVVQNISETWTQALCTGLCIERSFFERHLTNLPRSQLWEDGQAWQIGAAPCSEYHVDGMFEHHRSRETAEIQNRRHCFVEPPFSPQSSTRISYFRANEYLCEYHVESKDSLNS